MKWTEISVQCDGEGAEAVAELFNRFNSRPGEADTAAVIEVGGYDPVGELVDPVITVRTYVATNGDDSAAVVQQIREGLWFLSRIYPLPEPLIRDLEEQDWANAWKASYAPLPVGERLIIVPAWLADDEAVLEAARGRLPVILDPGMAFGTGLHPSTRLCMAALERAVQPGDAVLDVGCGSGVLSIAAGRLGAVSILATDIDPIAVEATVENCQRNGLTHLVQARAGSLPSLDERPQGWPVVVANILAEVIVLLLDEGMADLLAADGVLIMSGIIEPRAEAVLAALQRHDLRLVERVEEGDWVALAARRNQSS
ncbi:MAG: 50S ribosomal protein L11 methyltransferase [Anaerolineae bacterium]|nr:50S ribosomal protein L11 methyltransferase [Anaerolineae bacterium]